MEDLCKNCPDGVRGLCCYANMQVDDPRMNILLNNVPCPHLNLDIMKCKIYKKRHKVPWCKIGKNMFGKGGLPEGCLYLKEHSEREPYPKIPIEKAIKGLDPVKTALLVYFFNEKNNMTFMEHVEAKV